MLLMTLTTQGNPEPVFVFFSPFCNLMEFWFLATMASLFSPERLYKENVTTENEPSLNLLKLDYDTIYLLYRQEKITLLCYFPVIKLL